MRAKKVKRCDCGVPKPTDVIINDDELLHFSVDEHGELIELWLKLWELRDFHVPTWTDYIYQQIGLDGKPKEVFSDGQPYCPPYDTLFVCQWPIVRAGLIRWNAT